MAISDFLKSTALPMISLNLCQSTSVAGSDCLEASIVINNAKKELVDMFQRISDSISGAQRIIFLVPDPCFPSAYETENTENQQIFTWSTDYYSHPLSAYFECIIKTGLELVGILEIRMKMNYAIFVIKKQDLLSSQNQLGFEFGSSIDNLSSSSTLPEMVLDGSKHLSLPSTPSQ